jgi:nicotinate-nucleotide pyrophosphorylase (carboxylating)
VIWREEIIKKIILLALEEDLSPNGDLSLQLIENSNEIKKAQIIAKESGVMACSWICSAVLEEYSKHYHHTKSRAKLVILKKDGENFLKGDVLIELEAPIHSLLSCERTMLNFLQRLCAIAKAAREYTDLIKEYQAELLDTRKTMPGMRALEKEAFRIGGGTNHRFNLSDAVMLKENHLSVINRHCEISKIPWQSIVSDTKTIIEINKDNLNQLDKWLELGVDQIMLDNFSAEEVKNIIINIKETKQAILKDTKIEVSGNITKDNILDYAKAGVDYISTSACMTRIHNLDLSMKIL